MTEDELAAADLYDPAARDAGERLELLDYLLDEGLQDCAIAVTPVASAVLPFDSYTTFSVNGADLTVVTNRQNDNQRSDSGFHAIAVC